MNAIQMAERRQSPFGRDLERDVVQVRIDRLHSVRIAILRVELLEPSPARRP